MERKKSAKKKDELFESELWWAVLNKNYMPYVNVWIALCVCV